MEENKPPSDESIKQPSIKIDGSSSQNSVDLINQANIAALRLEEANNKLIENINRIEKLAIENKFHGVTFAGKKDQSDDEKEIEKAKEFLKGTGFEDEIFNDK